MFRNFYKEQNMADPRDSWYKPNLLYNIHYRPPKQTSPPKMEVVTKKFNPSVCTCGKHGCEPHYRMEREVVWLKKGVEGKDSIEVKEKIRIERDDKTETKDEDCGEGDKQIKVDGNNKLINNSSKEDGEYHVKLVGHGMNDSEVGCQANTLLISEEYDKGEHDSGVETQKDNLRIRIGDTVQEMFEEVQAAGGNEVIEMYGKSGVEEDDQNTSEQYARVKYELSDCSPEERTKHDNNSSVDVTANEELVKKQNENTELEQNSNGIDLERNIPQSSSRFDYMASPEESEIDLPDVTECEATLGVDIEEYGSAFGIIRVFCDSELHIEWNRRTSEY